MAKLELIECPTGEKILHVEAQGQDEFKLLEKFWGAAEFGPGGVELEGGTMSESWAYIRFGTRPARR